jgi:hypothetical protein
MTILAQRPAKRTAAGKIQTYGYTVQVSATPPTKADDDRFLAWVNSIAEKTGHRPVELRQESSCA